MSRRILKGSLILLIIAIIAILIHSLPFSLETHEIEARGSRLAARGSVLSPEQKFLIRGPIDINEATIEDLDAIPHVGQALANRIIAFRTESGTFKNIEELLEVKGIGPRILEEIKPYLK